MTSPLRKKKNTILNLRKSKHSVNEPLNGQQQEGNAHRTTTAKEEEEVLHSSSSWNTANELHSANDAIKERNDKGTVTLVSDDDEEDKDKSNHLHNKEKRTDQNDVMKEEETIDAFELNPIIVMDPVIKTTNMTMNNHTVDIKEDSKQNAQDSLSPKTTTTSSSQDEPVPTETIFRRSILRTNNTSDTQKRSVSFADDNNLPITTQRTISVSPNKLIRRVRRGKAENATPSAYESSTFLPEQHNLIMGRVLVLLMDPPSKQYELTSVPYPLVSNEDNHVGPTKLKDILKLVARSASYEPLQKQMYQCFCRPDQGGGMDNELTIMDYNFSKDEVLIGVPEGYKTEQCQAFAKPILEDKRLVKLLKKLKKYDRRLDRKKRFEKSLQLNMKQRTAENDRLENKNLEIQVNWHQLIAGLVAIICLAVLIGGGIGIAHKKSLASELQILKKMEKDRQCKGRGIFGCKPFGLKHHIKKPRNQMLQNAIQEISNWKLEGDDLML
jgi:hypothetical protein